jgi:pimeloyl-ACP methyl ester carboxylesterase
MDMDAIQIEVESGTATLAVTQWGEGGPPIVALHPGVGDSRIWRWCAPVWAAAGNRVIAYDRRGFGRTSYDGGPHDDLADLLAVLDATSTDSAIVVGNSKGGGLGLDLAIERPERVKALVLLAPSVSGYDYSASVEVAAEAEQDALITAAVDGGDLDEVNRLELRYWLDGVEQPEGRVSGEPRDLMQDMNGIALRAESVGEATERSETWSRLGDIRVPTLVVFGALDLPGTGPMCEALAAALPFGDVRLMADSAHCPSLDAPDELNQIVLEFADRNTPC